MKKNVRSFLTSFFLSLTLIFGACFGLFTLAGKFFDKFLVANSDTSYDADVWDGTDDVGTVNVDYVINGNNLHIYTAKGLMYFVKNFDDHNSANKTIYLERNIDLNYHEWTPISGVFSGNFLGSETGKNKTIYNLKITNSGSNVGFFSQTNNAVIQNISLENIDINVISDNIGGLVGSATTTTIKNCVVEGKINPITSYGSDCVCVGGIVGSIIGKKSNENESLSTVFSRVKITCSYKSKIGGLAGYGNAPIFDQCINAGEIISDSNEVSNIGGLIGESSGDTKITNSYNNGKLMLKNGYMAGIVGLVTSEIEINHVYNAGNLLYTTMYAILDEENSIIGEEGQEDIYVYKKNDDVNLTDLTLCVAGIAYFDNSVTKDFYIMNSFNIGDICYYVPVTEEEPEDPSEPTEPAEPEEDEEEKTIIEQYFSPDVYVISNRFSNNVFNNYYDKNCIIEVCYDVTSYPTNNYRKGADPKTNLRALATSEGFLSNINLWNIKDANGNIDIADVSQFWNKNYWEVKSSYPILRNVAKLTDSVTTSEKTELRGEGTSVNPYKISTASDLAIMSRMVLGGDRNGYYELENDIDLSGRNWYPIGVSTSAFSGNFNGNGYTISGLNCAMSSLTTNNIGLFGVVDGGVIKDVIIRNFKYLTDTSTTGTLVSSVQNNAYIINCFDDNSYSDINSNIYTIGEIVEGTVPSYVIYGDINGEVTEYNVTKAIRINPTIASDSSKYKVGYLVNIDGGKGSFYRCEGEKISTIYPGKYRIAFEICRDTDASITNYENVIEIEKDTTFGVNVPGLLTDAVYNGTIRDYWTLTGSKLSGYTKNNFLNFTVNASPDVYYDLRIYLNNYEINNYFNTDLDLMTGIPSGTRLPDGSELQALEIKKSYLINSATNVHTEGIVKSYFIKVRVGYDQLLGDLKINDGTIYLDDGSPNGTEVPGSVLNTSELFELQKLLNNNFFKVNALFNKEYKEELYLSPSQTEKFRQQITWNENEGLYENDYFCGFSCCATNIVNGTNPYYKFYIQWKGSEQQNIVRIKVIETMDGQVNKNGNIANPLKSFLIQNMTQEGRPTIEAYTKGIGGNPDHKDPNLKDLTNETSSDEGIISNTYGFYIDYNYTPGDKIRLTLDRTNGYRFVNPSLVFDAESDPNRQVVEQNYLDIYGSVQYVHNEADDGGLFSYTYNLDLENLGGDFEIVLNLQRVTYNAIITADPGAFIGLAGDKKENNEYYAGLAINSNHNKPMLLKSNDAKVEYATQYTGSSTIEGDYITYTLNLEKFIVKYYKPGNVTENQEGTYILLFDKIDVNNWIARIELVGQEVPIDGSSNNKVNVYHLQYKSQEQFTLICESSGSKAFENPAYNNIAFNKINLKTDGLKDLDGQSVVWKYVLELDDAYVQVNRQDIGGYKYKTDEEINTLLNDENGTAKIEFAATASKTTLNIELDFIDKEAFGPDDGTSEIPLWAEYLPNVILSGKRIEEDETTDLWKDVNTSYRITRRISTETNQIIFDIDAGASLYYALLYSDNDSVTMTSDSRGHFDENGNPIYNYIQNYTIYFTDNNYATFIPLPNASVYDENGELLSLRVIVDLRSDEELTPGDVYKLKINFDYRLYKIHAKVIEDVELNKLENNPNVEFDYDSVDGSNETQSKYVNVKYNNYGKVDTAVDGAEISTGTLGNVNVTFRFQDLVRLFYDPTYGATSYIESFSEGLLRGYNFIGWYSFKMHRYYAQTNNIQFKLENIYRFWGNQFLFVVARKDLNFTLSNQTDIANYNGSGEFVQITNTDNGYFKYSNDKNLYYTYYKHDETVKNLSLNGSVNLESTQTGYKFNGWHLTFNNLQIKSNSSINLSKGKYNYDFYIYEDEVNGSKKIRVLIYSSKQGLQSNKELIYDSLSSPQAKGDFNVLFTNSNSGKNDFDFSTISLKNFNSEICNKVFNSFLIDAITQANNIGIISPILTQAKVTIKVAWGIKAEGNFDYDENLHKDTYEVDYYYGQRIDLRDFGNYTTLVGSTKKEIGYSYFKLGETQSTHAGTIDLANNVMNNRKGYNTNYWGYTTDKNKTLVLLTEDTFEISSIYTSSVPVTEIKLERQWQAKTYRIYLSYDPVTESFSNRVATNLTVTYGQSVNIGNPILQDWDTDLTSTGYSRRLCFCEGTEHERDCQYKNVDATNLVPIWEVLELKEGEERYLTRNDIYKFDRNITIQALWIENNYIITVDANKGTFADDSISKEYEIEYSKNIFGNVTGFDYNDQPTRLEGGYEFSGWYLFSTSVEAKFGLSFGSLAQLNEEAVLTKTISANDIFSIAIHEGVSNIVVSTTLPNGKSTYIINKDFISIVARWDYKDYYSFSITENVIKGEYTGEEQRLYINNLGEDNLNMVGFELDESSIIPNFKINTGDSDSLVQYEFDDGNKLNYQFVQDIDANYYISATNVGSYLATLYITVVDNAAFFNLGNVAELSYVINYIIEKANLSYIEKDAIMDDQGNLSLGSVSVEVLKYYISLVGNESIKNSAKSWNTIADFTNYYQTSGEYVSQYDYKVYYNYLLVKHYMLLMNSNDENASTKANYDLAKNMNFRQYYNSYNVGDKVAENEQLVKNAFYSVEFSNFEFNKIKETEILKSDYAYYFDKMMFSSTVGNVNDQLEVNRIMLISNVSNTPMGPSVNSTYEVRVYINSKSITSNDITNYCANYNLVSSNGEYYLIVGYGTILPSVIELSITGNNQAYFNEQSHIINWYSKFTENEISVNGARKTAYLWNETSRIYLIMRMQTSDAGSSEVDTNYSWDGTYDEESGTLINLFKIYDLAVVKDNSTDLGDNYQTVTSYFTITFNNDTSNATNKKRSIYTILNTKDIDHYSMDAMLLTKISGSDDLSFSQVSEIQIYVKSVVVNVSGTNVTFTNVGIPTASTTIIGDSTYYADGTACFQIEGYGTSRCKVHFNKTVKEIEFAIEQNKIGDYTFFYKWGASDEENINTLVEMETYQPVLNYKISDLSAKGGEEKTYYSIFTDLLLAVYNFGLVENETMISGGETQTILQNGVSTAESLNLTPERQGFSFSTYYLKGTQRDYTTAFNPTYTSGIASLYIDAVWILSDVSISQLQTEIDDSTIESNYQILFEDVYEILNNNSLAITYTFEWLYSSDNTEFEVVETEEGILSLPGSTDSNGYYKVRITASAYGQTKTTESASFKLTLHQMKIVEINWDEINGSYNGTDYSTSTFVAIVTSPYPYNDDSKKATTRKLLNVTTGSLYFTIASDGVSVTEMKNAGTYIVTLHYDNKMYTLDSGLTLDKQYVIEKYRVTLSAPDISKEFNTADPVIKYDYTFFAEKVTVYFTRESGEAIGTYDVNYKECSNQNFIFLNSEGEVLDDTTNFEDAFKIIAKTTDVDIVLDLENLREFTYDANRTYSITIDSVDTAGTVNHYVMIRSAADTIRLKMSFFDNSANAVDTAIESGRINFTSRILTFDGLQNAKNAGVYKITLANVLCSEFSGMKFSNNTIYNFTINKKTITTASISFVKDYDGTDSAALESTDIYEADKSTVSLIGTFSSVHAGSNLDVSLRLDGNTTNYVLESERVSGVGVINKIDTYITFRVLESNISYGLINANNIKDNIVFEIKNSETDAVITLIDGYYNAEVAIVATADDYFGENSLLQVGKYDITLAEGYWFTDFNVDITSNTKLEINKYRLNLTLNNRYSIYYGETMPTTITHEEAVAYTGETVSIILNVLNPGNVYEIGSYDLQLVSFDHTRNYDVTVNGIDGFSILTNDKTVFVRIENFDFNTDFKYTYNSKHYKLILKLVSGSYKLLVLSDGRTLVSYDVSFFIKDDENNNINPVSLVPGSALDTNDGVEIFNSKNAGNHELTIPLIANIGYNGMDFLEDYIFHVDKYEIALNTLTNFADNKIVVNYTGVNAYTLTTTSVFTGDDVIITANFDTPRAGDNKSVSLMITGLDKDNYYVAVTTLNGKINKLNAILKIEAQSVDYGTITRNTIIQYKLLDSVDDTVEYTTNFVTGSIRYTSSGNVIDDSFYSENGYLIAGTYSYDKTNIVFTDYEITNTRFGTLTVNKLEQRLTLYAGQYTKILGVRDDGLVDIAHQTTLGETVYLTFTREPGEEMANYKILTAVGYNSVTGTDGRAENLNYNFVVIDNDGAFQILPNNTILYILLDTNDIPKLTYTYNGNEFEITSFIKEEEDYYFVITNSGSETKIRVLPTVFEDGEYKVLDEIENFNLQFVLSSTAKDAGTYSISMNAISTGIYTNYKLGPYGETSNYNLIINKRELTLENISKVYDGSAILTLNSEQLFTLSQNAEEDNRFIENDDLEIGFRFVDKNGENASHANEENEEYNLVINSTSGSSVDNYILGSYKGKILKSTVIITPNSYNTSYIYGNIVNITYTAVDINGNPITNTYLQQYVTGSLTVAADAELDYSTSGNLKVGKYAISNDGENPLTFKDYNVQIAENDIEIEIIERSINIVAISNITLGDIFYKVYDGNNSINIENASGQKLIGFNSIITNDDIFIDKAYYEDKEVGSGKTIKFDILGDDKENYIIEGSYNFGIIENFEFNLTFNYNDGEFVDGNKADGKVTQILTLKYPFVSTSNITSNVTVNSATIFPGNVTSTGYDFINWAYEYNGTKYVLTNDANGITTLSNILKQIENADALKEFTGFEVVAIWKIKTFNVKISVTDTKGIVDNKRGEPKLYRNDNGNLTEVELIKDQDNILVGEIEYYSTFVLELTSTYYTFSALLVDDLRISNNSLESIEGGKKYTHKNRVTEDIKITAMFKDMALKVNLILRKLENSEPQIRGSGTGYTLYSGHNNTYQRTVTFDNIKDQTIQTFMPVISATGHKLVGWSIDGIETEIVTAESLIEDLFLRKDGYLYEDLSLELYAMWEAETYSVKVQGNGGKFGEVENADISIKYNQTIREALQEAYRNNLIATSLPYRKGYTLTKFMYNTVEINIDDQFLQTRNITLVAQWEKTLFTFYITAKNAEITSSTILNIDENGNYYFNAYYGDEKTFKVTMIDGYLLDEDSKWQTPEDIGLTIFNKNDTNTYTEFKLKIDTDVNEGKIIVATTSVMNMVTINITNATAQVLVEDEEMEVTYETGYLTFLVPTEGVAKVTLIADKGYYFQATNFPVSTGYCDIANSMIISGNLVFDVKNITADCIINGSVSAKSNSILMRFTDESKVKNWSVVSGGSKSNSVITANTGNIVLVQITYVKGYASDETLVNGEKITISAGTSFNAEELIVMTLQLSNFNEDTTITIGHKLRTYTIKTEAVTYNSDKTVKYYDSLCVSNLNLYYFDAEVEFNELVKLTVSVSDGYEFIGYYHDEEGTDKELISTEETYDYQVTNNATIYALFRVKSYNIAISILEEYKTLNMAGEVVGTEYNEIHVASIRNEEGQLITSAIVFNRESTSVTIQTGENYEYKGQVAYFDNSLGKYVIDTNNIETTVDSNKITIKGDLNIKNQYFVIISAKRIEVTVNTVLQIKGKNNYRDFVANVTLIDANSNEYVEGNTSFASENSSSVMEDDTKKFLSISSIYGHKMYLKISEKVKGYLFEDLITANTTNLINSGVDENGLNFYIFQILNLEDGNNVDVVFVAQENAISIIYTNDNGRDVKGGNVTITDAQDGMAYIASSSVESVVVNALTESYFEITASVFAGYKIFDKETLENNFVYEGITVDNISYTEYDTRLTILTNFTGVIKFRVSGYNQDTELRIKLFAERYTVEFKDNADVLVVVENVVFGEDINLSKDNKSNITILQNAYDIKFTDEKDYLDMFVTKENYRFNGYYTMQLAGGNNYIDSEGRVIEGAYWKETGYKWNGSEYSVTPNATIDESGHITIRLYIYWSYKKTGINITMLPERLDNSLNIYSVVSSNNLNGDNSHWTSSRPMYFELAYETRITLSAPEIDGYKFDYMLINIMMSNGKELAEIRNTNSYYVFKADDTYSVSDLAITFVYKVFVNVEIYHGNATYKLIQNGAEVNDGYVDYTKDFDFLLEIEKGYQLQFVCYFNTNEFFYDNQFTITPKEETINIYVYLEGADVTLKLGEYDDRYGKIENIDVYSPNSFSSVPNENLVQGSEIGLKVGDYIIISMSLKYGYLIEWNDDRIIEQSKVGNLKRYRLDIDSTFMDTMVEITPEISGEILSIVINMNINEVVENAVDENLGKNAGKILRGKETVGSFEMEFGSELSLTVDTNDRYDLTSVKMTNNENAMTLFGTDAVALEGLYFLIDTLTITVNAFEKYEITGEIKFDFEFERVYWQELAPNDLFKGQGTKNNPYKISSAEELALLSKLSNGGFKNTNDVEYRNCYYVLTSNITLNDAFWDPIGTEESEFNGTFNFDIYNVYDIFVYQNYEEDVLSYGGLFHVLGKDANIYKSDSGIKLLYIISIVVVAIILIVIIILIIISTNRKKKLNSLTQSSTRYNSKSELEREEKQLKNRNNTKDNGDI